MSDSPINASILIEGKANDYSNYLASIKINKAISCVGSAELTFMLSPQDMEQPGGGFPEFTPGASLEIRVGYGTEESTLFKGLIVKMGCRFDELNHLVEIRLKCGEEAIKLTLGHKNALFRQKSDSQVFQEIIGSYGLSAQVEATDYDHAQLIQYQSTDWDFLVARAEANGLLVYSEDQSIQVCKPNDTGKSNLKIRFGENALSMDTSWDARDQIEKVRTQVWDFKGQRVAETLSSEPDMLKSGDWSGLNMSKAMGQPTSTLSTAAVLDPAEQSAWAKSSLLKTRMAGFQGNASIMGSALPRLNQPVELSGFGTRLDGKVLVSSIFHEINAGVWRTNLGFGLSSLQKGSQEWLGSKAAGGLLPPVSGLQNGIVKQIDQDPDQEYRVLVDVPLLDPDGNGIWARMGQGYAGAGAGSFFFPEIGDEVFIGFLNDDPRYPVILGMAYSSKKKPPFIPEAENAVKGFVTKSGIQLSFNDQKKSLTIQTPSGNTCMLSDDDKTIALQDQNGNSVRLDANGVSLNSNKDIVINAGGKVVINAGSDITATTSIGDIQLEGMNVNASANMALKVTGVASAELSAGAQAIVKGAMVMIN